MLRLIQLLLFCAMTMSTMMVSAFTATTTATVPLHVNSLISTRASVRCVLSSSSSQLNAVKNKKKLTKEELSYLEVRDMTREEMLKLNAENERVMNQELTYMTIFSLIISAPLLYLAWVGFFAETAEIAM
jgi:hypothetical protein